MEPSLHIAQETYSQQNTQSIMNIVTDLKRQKKVFWRTLILFTMIFLAILLGLTFVSLVFMDSSILATIQKSNVSQQRNIDYLQFVVPVLIAVGGFFVVFLGLNRLRDFDEKIEATRQEITTQMRSEREELQNLRSNLREELLASASVLIDEKMQNKISELDAHKKDGIQHLNDQEQKCITSILNSSISSIEDINQMQANLDLKMDHFVSKYEWLAVIKPFNPDQLNIRSVEAAHDLLEVLFKEKPNGYLQIVEQVVVLVVSGDDRGKLRGSSTHYFNVAAELSRNDFSNLACQVCLAGLEHFEADVDLLATLLQYSAEIGDFGVSEDAYIRLKDILKEHWNWRAFHFSADYLQLGTKGHTFDEAIAVCAEYINRMPYDERAYRKMADLYEDIGNRVKAEDILQQALNANIVCPQCANRLAQLYYEKDELEAAIEFANRAVRNLAQEQPSVNFAYVFFRRGMCKDSILHRDMKKLNVSEIDIQARDAINDYILALKSDLLSRVVSDQAQHRVGLLMTYLSTE